VGLTLKPGLKPEPSPAEPEPLTRARLQVFVSRALPSRAQAGAFEPSRAVPKHYVELRLSHLRGSNSRDQQGYCASVTSALADAVVLQRVTVVTTHMEFLRVATNDPHQQFLRLRDLVDSFKFPDLRRRLPFTILRRLVIQRLVSRLQPRIGFQPLLRADADTLDTAIARKIHDYLRFPFPFGSTLLTLPLHLYGFDFPSVARINDVAAVSGLLRDLNHHLPLFSNMARITLADWTCSLAHCTSPLRLHSPAFDRS